MFLPFIIKPRKNKRNSKTFEKWRLLIIKDGSQTNQIEGGAFCNSNYWCLCFDEEFLNKDVPKMTSERDS